jgi:hypothetical protein
VHVNQEVKTWTQATEEAQNIIYSLTHATTDKNVHSKNEKEALILTNK